MTTKSETSTKLNKKPRLTKKLKLKYALEHLEFEIENFKDNIDEYISECLLPYSYDENDLDEVEYAIEKIQDTWGSHTNYSCHQGDDDKKEYERKVARIIAVVQGDVEPHFLEKYYPMNSYWSEKVKLHLEGKEPLEFSMGQRFGWDNISWTQEQENTLPEKLRMNHWWLDKEKYPNGYESKYN